MNKLRYLMFIVTALLVLAISAMVTIPALADEGAPPVETVSEEAPPVEEVAEDAAPAAAEEANTSSAPEPASVTDEAPPVEEIIEQLPEDTELIVVGDNGEALPLATQEAADVIATADPQWCPTGATPGSATCSPVFTSFNDPSTVGIVDSLIEWLDTNNPGQAGVIWIEDDYNSTTAGEGGPVTLNGADYGDMQNFALTINGGWAGGTSKVLNPNTPSEFNVPFIINWNAPVTINNLLIENASGGGGWALEVVTTGNIIVNNVDVQNNTTIAGGAYLSNSSGQTNLTVNDSTFNGNGGYAGGLQISTEGAATFKNIHAINNDGFGAYISNSDAVTPKAVTFTGSNNFSGNGQGGLNVYSDGAITLSNVTAMGNAGGSGAYLDNCAGFDADEYCLNTAPSAVTLKGTNNFSNNGWDGLRVWTPGTITINNLTANDNGTDPAREAADVSNEYDHQISGDEYDAFGKGAFLNNWGAQTAKAITFTGVNTFNGNASNGLFAYGYGALKVNALTANDNDCDIAYDTDVLFCAGAYLNALNITQTGTGTFTDNDTSGLFVHALNGMVTLNNLYAEGNSLVGVGVTTQAGPTPNNISVLGVNVFNDNGDSGLGIASNGIVTLNNLTANDNDNVGVYVDNTDATTAKAVILKGTNVFNNNIFDGLEVYSQGAITTSNITAMFNGDGVTLDNCNEVISDVCDTDSAQSVTMNGFNNISDNDNSGLTVYSRGAIKVNNLKANSNGSTGAELDNSWDNAVGTLALTGYGITSENGGDYGLLIYSTGAVTLTNLTANNNSYAGVRILNDFNSLAPANVTITGINLFNDNGDHGLQIDAYGTVLLNNVTANDNGNPGTAYGAYIRNDGGSMARPVTLNGINNFNGNESGGLSIESLGAITVSKITANGTTAGDGAILDNNANVFTVPLTILGYGVFNNNSGVGFSIDSNGMITLANLTANNNGGDGAHINNYKIPAASAGVNVTLTGVNIFSGNGSEGLTVYSDGHITLSNITANDNGGVGAFLDHLTNGGVNKNITMTGSNTFVSNGLHGLQFNASGSASITRITADLNDDGVGGAPAFSGVRGTAVGSITLTCGSLNMNEGYGYNLDAAAITLKGVYTLGNPDGNTSTVIPIITRTCPLP
jgi:putative surface-exposed virulence protein